jgi:hypothetical protein
VTPREPIAPKPADVCACGCAGAVHVTTFEGPLSTRVSRGSRCPVEAHGVHHFAPTFVIGADAAPANPEGLAAAALTVSLEGHFDP